VRKRNVSSDVKRLYLLDGTSVLFRAFYAIRNLTSPAGRPTNATFGFTQMLRRLLQQEDPKHIAVAFDRPEPTHRHEAFQKYKANRPSPPEDLVLQISDVKESCRVLGVPTVELPGYEADDLIGTLSQKATRDGFQVIIVASDKDLLQLVNDTTRVLNPVKGDLFDREGVRQTFGVDPEQVVEVLALMGDASDNIPGVPGIGEKGAKDLIRRYGSLEGCLGHLEEISRRSYRENLVRYQDQARLSRDLARIRFDVPIHWGPNEYQRREPSQDEAQRFFAELGFNKLAGEMRGSTVPVVAEGFQESGLEDQVDVLRDPADLRRLAEELVRAERLALTAVFSGPDPMRANLIGLALAPALGRTVYVPIACPELESSVPVCERDLIEALHACFVDGRLRKIGEDLKTLQVYLLRKGFPLAGLDLDTSVAAYLLDPDRGDYGLESLAIAFLALPKDGVPAPGRVHRPSNPTERPVDEMALEVGRKCQTLLMLEGPIRRRMEGAGLDLLYREVEGPLLTILAEMEWRGVRVDVQFLHNLSRRWGEELEALERKAYQLAGEEFNIHSPRQLRRVLFDKLGLTPGRRTEKEKAFSTGMDVLEELARMHPLPAAILEYRSLAKLQSTYVDALPRLVHPATGRVHATFNQTAAATGRLSSSNPNLQNIPVRTEMGRQIRKAFIAEEGWRIMTADYSQIELRVLAHLARDPEMIRAFQSGEDIHVRTASQVFGISPELVTPDLRRQAKAVNFGIIYGMGAFRLGKELGVSNSLARRFMNQYMDRFEGVKRYVEEVVRRAEKEGGVVTLFGRIRQVPEIRSRNANLRRQGIRVAVNTTVQGTAADLIKMAMVRLGRNLKEAGLKSRLLIQVHDELLLEVPEEEVEAVSVMVRDAMEHCHSLEVPLVAEVRTGPNWLEMGAQTREVRSSCT